LPISVAIMVVLLAAAMEIGLAVACWWCAVDREVDRVIVDHAKQFTVLVRCNYYVVLPLGGPNCCPLPSFVSVESLLGVINTMLGASPGVGSCGFFLVARFWVAVHLTCVCLLWTMYQWDQH